MTDGDPSKHHSRITAALNLCVEVLALRSNISKVTVLEDIEGGTPRLSLSMSDDRGEFTAILGHNVVHDLIVEGLNVLTEKGDDYALEAKACVGSPQMLLEDAIMVVSEEIWLRRHNEPLRSELLYELSPP